jgi:hypothetical protein
MHRTSLPLSPAWLLVTAALAWSLTACRASHSDTPTADTNTDPTAIAAPGGAPEGSGVGAIPGAGPGPTGGRRVIDAHAHLFGDGAWPLVREVLDTHGIEYIVNLSGGSPHSRMRPAYQLAIDSGGRVLNAMNVDWGGFPSPAFGEAVANELELLVTRYGYVALKISKALGLGVTDEEERLIPVDDPRLFPIWERAGALGVPVFIHTGDPRAFWEPVTPENERYAELSAHPSWSYASPLYPRRETLLAQRDHLFELFPQTTFIAVHFGNNPEDLQYVASLLDRFPNVYVDLAARLPEIGRHPAAEVREVFVRHAGRILFATDIAVGIGRDGPAYTLGSSGPVPDTAEGVGPFYARHWQWLETNDVGMAHPTPIQGDWTIDAIGLPPEVLDRIYYRNAYDLIVAPWLARGGLPAAAPPGAP